jgi:hypothetical protein
MLAPKIDYRNHHETAHEVTMLLPGATVDDLPEGEFAAVEYAQLNTHNGTHLASRRCVAFSFDDEQR